MPFKNIFAIVLALALGQYAWAQTPQGGPNPEYVIPIDPDPWNGGGGGKWCCSEPEFVTPTKYIVWFKACLKSGDYDQKKVFTGGRAWDDAENWRAMNCFN